MINKKVGKLIGARERIRDSTLMKSNKRFLWHTVEHSNRQGIKHVIMFAKTRENYNKGKIRFSEKGKILAGVNYHEIALQNPLETKLYIYSLRVRKNYQREKFATTAIKEIISIAKSEKRVKFLELEVNSNNKTAIKFYKSLGFREEKS
ncbi:MAG: GNAT family N-acetyltransferase [archaeon]